MGIIQEEIEHPRIDNIELIVDQHMKGEVREPYDIIHLDTSFSIIETPDELIDHGNWLVEQGKYIKKKYTSKGAVRKSHKNSSK